MANLLSPMATKMLDTLFNQQVAKFVLVQFEAQQVMRRRSFMALG